MYEKVKRLLPAFKVSDINEKFDTVVSIRGCVPVTNAEELANAIFNATKGAVQVLYNKANI